MKSVFTKLAVVLLMLPAFALADVKSDMNNANMSLVVVMQNAIADGMSAGEAVAAMIKADESQSSGIVATAMIVAPEQFDAIVKAAIDAGVPAGNVVAAALISADGENADNIIASAVTAAPSQQQAIKDAAVRALPQTKSGIAAVAGSPLQPTQAKASGGGASVTAAQVTDIQNTLAQIGADLAAVGFSTGDVAQAVSDITTALAESQTDVATATQALVTVQADIAAAQAAQANLASVEAAQAEAVAAAAAAEASVDASIQAASAAAAAAELAQARAQSTAAAIAFQKAQTQELEEIKALAETDPEAAQARLDEFAAQQQAEIASLGVSSQEELDALVNQTLASIEDNGAEVGRLDLEIQQATAVLAQLEALSAAGAGNPAALALSERSSAQLRALIDSLNSQKDAAQKILDDDNARAASLASQQFLQFGFPVPAGGSEDGNQADIDNLGAQIAILTEALTSSEVELEDLLDAVDEAQSLLNNQLADVASGIATSVTTSANAILANDEAQKTKDAANLEAIRQGIGEVVLELDQSPSTTG